MTPSPSPERLIARLGGFTDTLGVPERSEYRPYRAGHVFRRDMRERSYARFDRWLGSRPDAAGRRRRRGGDDAPE